MNSFKRSGKTQQAATHYFRSLPYFILTCLMGLMSAPSEAARLDQVTKGSPYEHHFKVEATKEAGGIRVTLTVPQSMQGHQLSSVAYYVGTETRVRTNGTTLELLIDEESFEKGFVSAGYTDPNHKKGESGGFWAFQLDISSLADGVK
jgi:hypothetical protein